MAATAVCVIKNNPTATRAYAVVSGENGMVNITHFGSAAAYAGTIHLAGGGTMAPVSIEEMANGDYLIASRYTSSSASGVFLLRVTPGGAVVNQVMIGGQHAATDVIRAREMNDGSVMLLWTGACNFSNPNVFPTLANFTLAANGSPRTLVWWKGYQANAGEQLSIRDFRQDPATGNIVLVGTVTRPATLGQWPCIGEVDSLGGAPIGTLHTYSAGGPGGRAFERIDITADGWFVTGFDTIFSFPDFLQTLRVTKFTDTSTRVWDRFYTLDVMPSGIVERMGAVSTVFVAASGPPGNTGYLAIFSPATGAFGGCQAFHPSGSETFTGLALDTNQSPALPVMCGMYDATLDGSGTDYGYFVRTSANGSTPCSLPVFPSEVSAVVTPGTLPLQHPTLSNGTIACGYRSTPDVPIPVSVSITCLCIGCPPPTTSSVWWHQVCGPCPQQCGRADMGAQGGIAALCGDGVLDNNDFVVFIDYFFTGTDLADLGSQGGIEGPDGLFDNNDFVVFVEMFFTGC